MKPWSPYTITLKTFQVVSGRSTESGREQSQQSQDSGFDPIILAGSPDAVKAGVTPT